MTNSLSLTKKHLEYDEELLGFSEEHNKLLGFTEEHNKLLKFSEEHEKLLGFDDKLLRLGKKLIKCY